MNNQNKPNSYDNKISRSLTFANAVDSFCSFEYHLM